MLACKLGSIREFTGNVSTANISGNMFSCFALLKESGLLYGSGELGVDYHHDKKIIIFVLLALPILRNECFIAIT